MPDPNEVTDAEWLRRITVPMFDEEGQERLRLIAARLEGAGAVEEILAKVAQRIEGDGDPGKGGVDVTGGIPSEIYVAIGRGRYDDEYEVAKDTAESVRTWLVRYFRSPKAIKDFTEPTP